MEGAPVDFFISYASEDQTWAEWIAWQIEGEGHSVAVQAWDFEVGQDFLHEMRRYVRTAARVICVLTEAYSRSRMAEAEWRDVFARDPDGRLGLLVPVRVEDCEPPDLLRSRIYIDLVGMAESSAQEALLNGLTRGRRRPIRPPGFPGRADRSHDFPVPDDAPIRMVEVERGRPFDLPSPGWGVVHWRDESVGFDPDAYTSFQALLDALYLVLLANELPPFEYGNRWVIEAGPRCLAPLAWLLEGGGKVRDVRPDWQEETAIADLAAFPWWTIRLDPVVEDYLAVIVDDPRTIAKVQSDDLTRATLGQALKAGHGRPVASRSTQGVSAVLSRSALAVPAGERFLDIRGAVEARLLST